MLLFGVGFSCAVSLSLFLYSHSVLCIRMSIIVLFLSCVSCTVKYSKEDGLFITYVLQCSLGFSFSGPPRRLRCPPLTVPYSTVLY